MFEFVIRTSSSDSIVYPYAIFVRTHLQMLSLSEATSRICFVKIFKLYQDFNDDNNYTRVYKAGFSKVGHLYNLVTKHVTKYAVVATFKILQIIKKNISNFFYNFENFKSCYNSIFCNIFCYQIVQMSNFAETCFIYCSTIFKKFFTNFKKIFPKNLPIF